MITVDKEQFEIDVMEVTEDKGVKFKKIYKILRKITENSLKGRTGDC